MKTKITFLAFFISILCCSAHAQTATWIGSATGDWSTAANWSSGSIPLATDSVSIPETFTVTISENVGTVNRLSVSGKLIISGAGSLTIDQTVSANKGSIVNLAGGQIENNGIIVLKNSNTTSSNTVLNFAESVNDNKFTNNGIFTMDNTLGAYLPTIGRGIGTAQKKNDTSTGTSTFKMGGTMDFMIKAGCCLIETDNGGNLTLDGNLVLGSTSSYKDLRFIKILGGGSVKVAATANITVYSGFTNAGNGVINLQSATTVAPGSSFTNEGIVTIYSGTATTGYGMYFNTQGAAAINIVNNSGRLSFYGVYPKGAFYLGGNATTGANSLINTSTGVLTFASTDPALAFKIKDLSSAMIITNDGIVNLSSSSFGLGSGQTYTNNGTVNFNYVAGVKQVVDFKGKVFTSGENIIVNFPSAENAKMILSDLTGRTINVVELQNVNNTINTNNLKGIYIVRLIMNSGSYSQKICL